MSYNSPNATYLSMKSMIKLLLCFLFLMFGATLFADIAMDVRDAGTPEKTAEVLAKLETTIDSASKWDKVKFSGMKMVYYFRSTENATYAAGRQIYLDSIKKLGVEKEGLESSFLFGPVHPWWHATKNVAVVEEAIAYAKTIELSGSQKTELGRILAFGMNRKAEAIPYFEQAGSLGYNDLIRVHLEMGNTDKAVEVYYTGLDAGDMDPLTAANNFQKVWSAQVKTFKTEEARTAAKFRLQKLVDQYTGKMYEDTKVTPDKSPWRKALTLWAACSK